MPESDAFTQNADQDRLQEESLKILEEVREGELIEGEVIQIDDDYVYLDIGLKSEGKVSIVEFEHRPNLHDTVEVVLERRETSTGEVEISKKKAELKIYWRELREAFKFQQPISGKVAKIIKGGYEVEIGCGMKAFCPISKIDVLRVGNPDDYLGIKSNFLIDRLVAEHKTNIVLTRRLWLEQEMNKKRDQFFETVSIGDEVEGVVRNLTSFGAFIDLGGFDGLLHVNDICWGRVNRPKDYLHNGDTIKLKVIRLDPQEKQVNLSLKHFQPDPWTTFEKKYHLHQVVKGRVTKLTNFGIFIEIEEGIEGLAHISELSWIKRINHPKELFSIGDECEAKILGYDIPNGRISLGLKQVLPNPWDNIEKRYPVGCKGRWEVRKITNAGAFIELEEGIDAFLHADDLSWTKKIKNVSSVLKKNEMLDLVVTQVKPEERRIRVGLKHASPNPWISFMEKHPRGTIVEGKITGKTDFGVFVRVEGDIEGLIHKNHLTISQNEKADEKLASLKVDDDIKAAILEVNVLKRKLSLSVREMHYREERAEISKYMDGSDESPAPYTLADMLKDKGE